jgi:hypothetical protein
MTLTTATSRSPKWSTEATSADAMRSVLRLADQRRDVFPDRCVLSGVATTGATSWTATAWRGPRWVLFVPGAVAVLAHLLRRPHVIVSIPVSPAVWGRWRRRVVLSQGATAFGSVLIGVGLAVGGSAPLTGGVVVIIAAIASWARANRNWWITCVLDAARGVVTVEPTHSEFDRVACEIFVRSIH